MDASISGTVGQSLHAFGYRGRVSYSGYGEPMLNKDIYAHIWQMRYWLPDNVIEMNSNSDALNAERVRRLFDAGLTYLYLNLYDGPHQVEPLVKMMEAAGVPSRDYRLRCRWAAGDGVGIVMNNRGGALSYGEHAPLRESLDQRCHYPFYKLFIDWNGDALYCSNDWKRGRVIGNVKSQQIRDIWLSDAMREIRLRLARGNRNFASCRTCDVNGMLHGRSSFDRLMKHYDPAVAGD